MHHCVCVSFRHPDECSRLSSGGSGLERELRLPRQTVKICSGGSWSSFKPTGQSLVLPQAMCFWSGKYELPCLVYRVCVDLWKGRICHRNTTSCFSRTARMDYFCERTTVQVCRGHVCLFSNHSQADILHEARMICEHRTHSVLSISTVPNSARPD